MFEIIDAVKTLQALRADNRAVTALEYALVAAVMAGVALTAFTALGTKLTTALSGVTL